MNQGTLGVGSGRRVAALCALVALGCTALPSCEDELPKAGLGEGCLINTDCGDPLVCVFRRCHIQCEDSRDCAETLNCVEAERPYRVCQLEDEQDCTATAECPGEQVCGVDTSCRDGCVVNQDCGPEQVCASGTCAELDELVEGKLPVTTTATPEGQPCVYASDCQGTLMCLQNQCRYECKADKDCPADRQCSEDKLCVPVGGTGTGTGTGGAGGAGGSGAGGGLPMGYGAPCALLSECFSYGLVCGPGGTCAYQCSEDIDCPNFNACCINHSCYVGQACLGQGGGGVGGSGQGGGTVGQTCGANFDCDDGYWCNGPELCSAGLCVPPADSACNSHSACVVDSCNEPTPPYIVGTCFHTPVSGQDVDGDGHLALGCTGGDDCDDTRATVYAGAPEMCDAQDNDCDGLVDDHVMFPRGPTNGFDPNLNYTPPGGPYVMPFGMANHLMVGHGSGGMLHANELSSAAAVVTQTLAIGYFGPAVVEPGPDQALVVWGNDTIEAVRINVVGGNVTTTASTPVAAASPNYDVVWTGAYYLVAFTRLGNAHYTFVDSAGVPSGAVYDVDSGPGGPTGGVKVSVAQAGPVSLVAYVRPDGLGVDATVLRPNGGNFSPVGTVSLPGLVEPNRELVGTGTDFVYVPWNLGFEPELMQFAINAQNQLVLGPPFTFPLTLFTESLAIASDGVGVGIFGFDGIDANLLYFRPGSPNPPELTQALLLGTDTSCIARAYGGVGRLDLACAGEQWRTVGCP